METVFIKLLNMSISASWLILAVVIIRLFLKKAPRWSVCILWGFVALKLIVPFSFKSIFSLIPSDEVIPETIATEAHPHITSGIIYVDTVVNPVMEAHLAPQVGDSANPMQIVIFIASLVWCIGMVICLIYAMTSFIILKRKVRASKKISDKIYACDDVKSPFILGILRPVIYIPSGMNKDTLDYVIAHENAHLKRGDHFWKPLGFLILSVYWFNPICWVAYILLCRDIEFACDEKVIRDKDNTYVDSYSQALLDCNAHRRVIAACPLAFGETSVKDRIKGVLNYKKPAFWVIIVAIIVCIVMAVCFLTDPKKDESNLPAEQSEIQNDQTEVKPADDSGDNEIVRPQVNLSAPEGADMTELLYADKDKIIFSGYYGLFVYSKEQRTITNAIDLASIGCNYTQGDNCCEKFVSSDGNTVYLHPMSNTDMCVYDIGNDSLSRERYNLEGYDLHVAAIEGSYNKGDCETWTYDGLAYYTVLRHGETIGDLAYADVRLEDSKNAEWIHLFTSDVESGEGPDNIILESSENIGIDYSYDGINYVVDGDMVFKYKKELLGRSPGAVCDTRYIVLTNNPDITFEKVDRSIYSSDSADWLSDTIIIGMQAIDENGNAASTNPIGLTMRVTNVSSTGCTLVFEQSGGNVTGELQTGVAFTIQVKDADGQWVDVSEPNPLSWDDIAILISKDGITQLEVSWLYSYGELGVGHYRIGKEVMDFRKTADYDTYNVYAEFDIVSDIKASDWIEGLNLPEGYGVSGYMEIGWQGGFLILPKAYDNTGAGAEIEAPLEWQYGGMISRMPSASTSVTFKNGIPSQDGIPMQNHTIAEYVDIVPLERRPDGWYTILYKEEHDLYTAAEIADLESKGIDIQAISLTSEYWTFYYVKEGEPTYYILSLTTGRFTREEAQGIAERVKIKE